MGVGGRQCSTKERNTDRELEVQRKITYAEGATARLRISQDAGSNDNSLYHLT